MSYRSILVNLNIDDAVGPMLDLAIDLAGRFKAQLIGFSCADAHLPFHGPESSSIAAEVWAQERADIEGRLGELRVEFDKLTAGTIEAEWCQGVGDPTDTLATTARLSDLIVTRARSGASTGNAYRTVDPGGLVIQAGRPVLVVAEGDTHVSARKVAVAWKNTREARRALADSVPLLLSADEVSVVAVEHHSNTEARAGVADVAAFLARHGIRSRTEVLTGGQDVERISDFIVASEADTVVSGAYGHSRLREWAFGGVTRSLLDEVGLNRFMAN